VLEKRGGLVISASGGVMINPWPLVDAPAESPKLGETRQQSAARTTNWWWD